MTLNLEIIDAAYVYAKAEIDTLNTKELVPKMVFRRRLTRAAKISVFLADRVNFSDGRIMYGSAFGEVPATSNILNAINTKDHIGPTDFQNSVYNTAVSYLSILHGNTGEIMTVSSGDETSNKLLQMGAIKAMDGDEILLLATETLNIPNIEEINRCIDYLECGVALRVRITTESPTYSYEETASLKGFPPSLLHMLGVAKAYDDAGKCIVRVDI